MEEFTFGTMASDELKLVHHRASRSGLQHGHRLEPRDPAPGQPVTVTAITGPDLAPDQVACYYTLDGSDPEGSRGTSQTGQVVLLQRQEVTWDSLLWGYGASWQGTLPPQPEGITVRYRLGAWSESQPEVYADWPNVQETAEEAAAAFFAQRPLPEKPAGDPVRGHLFTYHVDRFAPPQWAREAVIYQVFVDRFHPGAGRKWLQTDDLEGFCGGTLWGAAEKLEYVAQLGASCVWLSPIFVSPTHHGYDATDTFQVSPRLGGDAALKSFVTEAHSRGLRVLLDLACNHISSQHPIFQEALANPASPYRDWFTFDDSEAGYRTFFAVPSMPQLNAQSLGARHWWMEVAAYWLREFAVDGFRLDYANGPGPDFWADFWAACKAEKPDSFCFGEVIDAPDALRTYQGRLDGCLDFHLCDALRRTYALHTWSEEQFARFLDRHLAYFQEVNSDGFLLPSFLDNHDMDRFLRIANGDKDALRRAAQVQMRLPGPPIIYYGTEVGVSQRHSTREGHGLHVSREPMAWGDDQDRDLLEFYRELIRQRRSGQQ